MRKYTIAYVAWLTAVLAAAAVALHWYRKVEGIGIREILRRIQEDDPYGVNGDSDFDPETAAVSEWGGAG